MKKKNKVYQTKESIIESAPVSYMYFKLLSSLSTPLRRGATHLDFTISIAHMRLQTITFIALHMCLYNPMDIHVNTTLLIFVGHDQAKTLEGIDGILEMRVWASVVASKIY